MGTSLMTVLSAVQSESKQTRGIAEGVVGDRVRSSWNASFPNCRHRVQAALAVVQVSKHNGLSIGVASGESCCGMEGPHRFRYYLIAGRAVSFAFLLERGACAEAERVAKEKKEIGAMSVVLVDTRVRQDSTEDVLFRHHRRAFSEKFDANKFVSVWHAIGLFPQANHGEEWMYAMERQREMDWFNKYNDVTKRLHAGETDMAMTIEDWPNADDPRVTFYYRELNKHLQGVKRREWFDRPYEMREYNEYALDEGIVEEIDSLPHAHSPSLPVFMPGGTERPHRGLPKNNSIRSLKTVTLPP
eukprot:Hpha_TRINITY_DN9371_c0_g1::TRINITY_DN9371_c0_g1_i1::g.26016::m.26016